MKGIPDQNPGAQIRFFLPLLSAKLHLPGFGGARAASLRQGKCQAIPRVPRCQWRKAALYWD